MKTIKKRYALTSLLLREQLQTRSKKVSEIRLLICSVFIRTGATGMLLVTYKFFVSDKHLPPLPPKCVQLTGELTKMSSTEMDEDEWRMAQVDRIKVSQVSNCDNVIIIILRVPVSFLEEGKVRESFGSVVIIKNPSEALITVSCGDGLGVVWHGGNEK